ncbi:MarR family transcriptional regulator [Mycobacterium intracellulare MOTT-02]|uniref:MarR family transcriptional regulator n=4 Tax=Mycobacterium TaxID=1763 RepID=A0A1X0KKD9_MYCSC|nr:MarR family transcriptional regulator [Mycobacterium intracellulare ATCC 13950]AFC47838.1 MarR family transcriptional regulator [Mycobacterium intracellulare MOTT-02]ASW94603.1 MarR family transcriptional regulator [Mycobacterium intracellulare]ETZ38009.1 marR family protein [Mycobacterium intracellulare MIN_061107_1834]MCA2262873.1 MarR family transcriptional regulator [Mycobacterium marseillense]MCV7120097.1 MarR family transcriptional regulator [Mycobacterium nebraskense]ORB75691.1 MarR
MIKSGGDPMPRRPRNPRSIAEEIARAADREDPGFDTAVLGLTLALFRTATAFERAHVSELLPHDLNISQLNILTVLDRASEPLTMGALGQAVSVLPANLTGVVDGLARRGYVERITNPDDRRSFLIRIGKPGRAFLRKFLPGHWAYLQTLMSDLTPPQKRQLQTLLGKFYDSIEQNCQTVTNGADLKRPRPRLRGQVSS